MTDVGFWDFALGAPLVGAGFSFGFVVVRWAANFIAGRIDRSQERLDEGTQQLIKHLREQVTILVGDCRELREWRTQAEGALRECERRHAESEAEVMRLKAAMQGYGNARQVAQLQVAADKALERSRRSGGGDE